MLCSECKKVVKPVAVLDIDGTLGDYHNHFHHFAERYLGHNLRAHYDGSCELHEWYRIDLELYRQVKLAYRQGGLKRTMPCLAGASILTSRLRNAGVEVWIATTRPYLRLDNIDPDTREWLGRNHILYDGMVYSEKKYEQLSAIVEHDRVICVFDDLPEMYQSARGIWGASVPLLRAAQHNLFARKDGRNAFSTVAGPAAAGDAIMARLDFWQAAHA